MAGGWAVVFGSERRWATRKCYGWLPGSPAASVI